MISRYRVWLNNQGLDDIDDTILITDIKEKEPKMRYQAQEKGGTDGMRLLRARRLSQSVAVRFAVREYDTARRRDVCSRIRAWARDGYLTTSDRPDQRLWVVCEKLPTVTSALKWTDETEMTFTAYELPYWEDITPQKAAYTGRNGTAALMARGDAKSVLDAVITAGGAVNNLTIAVKGRSFAFAGLGLSKGGKLTISHDASGLLSIRAGNASALAKRTAESADELVILPQKANTITFTADADCTAVFTSRGRYT